MNLDVETFRTSLIITLAIVVVAMIVMRLRRRTLEKSVPAPLHAELLSLEVAYHPARLLVVVGLPISQIVRTTLLDQEHLVKYSWPEVRLEQGVHDLERVLPALANGIFYLEVSTSTQRTVRQFRLQ